MESKIDLTPNRFNAWRSATGAALKADAMGSGAYPSMDLRARFALSAAVSALGLEIAEAIVRPEALVVSLPHNFQAEVACREGFAVASSDEDVSSLEIMLAPPASNGSLAAILSVVSRLSRVIKAQGGQPDTATALDLVVEVFRTS